MNRTMRDFLGEDIWSRLLSRGIERQHATGSQLLRQGEPGTHVLALRGGVTKVVRHEHTGRAVLLAFRGPGELLGEVAVFDDDVRSASVEAISDCAVTVVSKAEFLRFAAEHELFPQLVRYAFHRLRESDQARATGALPSRLAAVLVRLAGLASAPSQPPADVTELALTRDDLAEHLQVSRNTVTAALSDLSAYLGVRRKCITVEDIHGLRRVADPVVHL
ncbi:Crp/Fnr family transcriptional regulator [Streptomyces sedi]|nr:Crp/Fnr family transcriptional regulator [Streptomyces sedi]